MKIFSITLLLLFPSIYVQAQVVQNIPLLTVTGESVHKAIPDYAVISVRVQKRIDVANISGVTDAFLFNKENADIKFFGADDQEIQPTIPEINMSETKSAVIFIKEFIITVKNVGDVARITMELLRRGFTDIYSVSYRVSNLNGLKQQACKLAIANARKTAEFYAAELGQTIGKAHTVTEEQTRIVNWYTEKYNPNIPQLLNIHYNFNPGYISIPCQMKVSFDLRVD
jgi:uncharacterized protein YggE